MQLYKLVTYRDTAISQLSLIPYFKIILFDIFLEILVKESQVVIWEKLGAKTNISFIDLFLKS